MEDFRETLVGGSGAESAQQMAADFWFTHNGYTAAPPCHQNSAKDLAEHITIVVHLDHYPVVDADITCEEPLPGLPKGYDDNGHGNCRKY